MKKTYENLEISVVMLTENIITESPEVSWDEDGWNI